MAQAFTSICVLPIHISVYVPGSFLFSPKTSYDHLQSTTVTLKERNEKRVKEAADRIQNEVKLFMDEIEGGGEDTGGDMEEKRE